MTLPATLQAYARAMAEPHLRRCLGFRVRSAANDNREWR
jgi:hypothetical protein